MNTHRTRKISLISLAVALALSLSACRTTPMYTEGDIHFEVTCVEDVGICQERLREACLEYDGEVVEIELRREPYLSEELKAKGVQAQSIHLTCRPPAEEDEPNAEGGK